MRQHIPVAATACNGHHADAIASQGIHAPLFFGDINGDGIKTRYMGNNFLGMEDGSFSGPYGLAIYHFMEALGTCWPISMEMAVDVVNHQFRSYVRYPFCNISRWMVSCKRHFPIHEPFRRNIRQRLSRPWEISTPTAVVILRWRSASEVCARWQNCCAIHTRRETSSRRVKTGNWPYNVCDK